MNLIVYSMCGSVKFGRINYLSSFVSPDEVVQVAGRACGGNHHPDSIPPMRKLPCLFWTPKWYWVRSSPGKAFPGEVDRCLTGPKGMTREAENPWIIKKKKYLPFVVYCSRH